jgi:hypothetical protein
MEYTVGSETVAAFRRDGFVVIDGLVQQPEIAQLRDMLLALHERNAGFAEGAQFDAAGPENGIKQRRFPQILNPRNFDARLMETGFHRCGLQIARQLLGPRARFRSDISFMKPARIGSDTPWHQDEAFGNPAFDHQEITIWLALTPASVANSCMSFIPGSQHFPVLEHRPMGGDPRSHALECIDGFDPAQAVACPLVAGSCTIHTHRTLHYAGPNNSDQFRLAYALLFDVPPTLSQERRDFYWQRAQQTERAVRMQDWRRRGGVFVHLWRQRHRIGIERGIAELHKYRRRLVDLWSQRRW